MASFFIRRPIVAIVIAIIIVLLGLNSLRGLSFEQYPFLAPPTIRITATYPGASAVAVEQSVATPVEQAELHRVQAYVHDIEKLVAQKENEISYLLGRNPGAVTRGRAVDRQPIPPQVPSGLPAELLERRPDIREAEQRLVSANALIGEAKAQLYPRISLTGSYGFASTDLGNLLEGTSQSWNFLAGLVQPIFSGGKNRRRVEMRQSQQRQAVYEYERTLLQALREVEDSLVSLQKAGEQRESQGLRVAAERKVLELSELRYRGGVAAYLEVLDAQRSLFNAEIDEVSSISGQVTSLIQLYKSLGGGWPPVGATPPEAAAATSEAAAAPPAAPVVVSEREGR